MGTDRPRKITTIYLGIFKGQQRRHRTPQETRCFYRTASLISGRAIPGTRTLTKKRENFFPGSSVDVSEVRLRYRNLVPKGWCLSRVPGWGILTPFPFGRRSETNTSMCVRFGRRLVRTDFSDPLGRLTHVQLRSMEPFSSFSPQGSHLVFANTTHRSATGALQAGSRRHLQTHATATLPTPLRRKPPRGSSAVAGRV
ncbi:hypothetical protein JTE90_006008 [Oedothorax gibbosus]|uniref:Uncharacterized protein n=1 Tax=Oedothorax gibbosus TaxID=931172 RepID=A0AAV6TGZ7_9ARAC|nr:hypothetical protein JTE90_006008 [Oedothorax gibbosus]